jgi:ParB/RepB/Spo0J family partition protein
VDFSQRDFSMAKLVNLKLEEIVVGEGVRKIIDEDSIQELSASFAKHGVFQPVLVQPREDHYELLIGARRLMAAKQAGLETIPALVLETPIGKALIRGNWMAIKQDINKTQAHWHSSLNTKSMPLMPMPPCRTARVDCRH